MTVLPFAGAASALTPQSHKVVLQDLEVDADIGFHAFEIGTPQRLLITVEVTLDLAHWPREDSRDAAWNYDFIRDGIHAIVRERRFNLQETLVRAIFEMIAARAGVRALTVSSRKPDVYADARAVGVVLSSE